MGSGGGLPGIPLAIARPDLVVTSIETVGKKASFQQQAKIELGLDNFEPLNKRVEQVLSGCAAFDDVISGRAFSASRTSSRCPPPAGRGRCAVRDEGRGSKRRGGAPLGTASSSGLMRAVGRRCHRISIRRA